MEMQIVDMTMELKITVSKATKYMSWRLVSKILLRLIQHAALAANTHNAHDLTFGLQNQMLGHWWRNSRRHVAWAVWWVFAHRHEPQLFASRDLIANRRYLLATTRCMFWVTMVNNIQVVKLRQTQNKGVAMIFICGRMLKIWWSEHCS